MWGQFLSGIAGLWLMAAPSVLAYGRPAAASDWITGPMIATFATVAMWQVTRPCRWINVALGGWLLLAPWVLGYGHALATANSLATGLAVIVFSLVKGGQRAQIGGGWRVLWSRPDRAVLDRP